MSSKYKTFLISLLVPFAVAACNFGVTEPAATEHAAATGSYERGPHNGRMLREGDLSIEVTIFEDGVDPEFRLYGYLNDEPLAPSAFNASIALTRLGDRVDPFNFTAQDDYLVGDAIVVEPHSFAVTVNAGTNGRNAQWQYDSFEGRTTIAQEQADLAGVVVEPAGPAQLEIIVPVTGEMDIPPAGRAEIRGWLEGRVTAIRATVGDRVTAGQVLARITATESLQTYSVTSPIAGVVVERETSLNAPTGDAPLFVVVDPSRLHAELFVYPSDTAQIEIGQPVTIRSVDGLRSVTSTIERIDPVVHRGSQRTIVHVEIPNEDGMWRPGETVSAGINVGVFEVPLAVRTDALQRFRDFTVVYARIGETYEVRMLDLGRQTPEWSEVLGGIDPAEIYVSENAFLIRADVEKTGATHDH